MTIWDFLDKASNEFDALIVLIIVLFAIYESIKVICEAIKGRKK